MLPTLREIQAATEVVYRTMPATPQYTWPLLNLRAGCEVWVKHENHGPVGAFKLRGGLVYMDWLSREQPGGEDGPYAPAWTALSKSATKRWRPWRRVPGRSGWRRS